MAYVLSFLPKALADEQIFKLHMGIRARALKKLAREAKSN